MLDFSFTPAQEEYRAVIGLKCVGAALQSVDETVEHARSRVVFGAPLAAHQGASFALADAATWLELARWQCYRVLWMRQQDIQCQSEGAIPRILAPGAGLRERIVMAREEVTALEEAD